MSAQEEVVKQGIVELGKLIDEEKDETLTRFYAYALQGHRLELERIRALRLAKTMEHVDMSLPNVHPDEPEVKATTACYENDLRKYRYAPRAWTNGRWMSLVIEKKKRRIWVPAVPHETRPEVMFRSRAKARRVARKYLREHGSNAWRLSD